MRLTVLGCGTSGGVPRIGNDWGECDPAEPRNRRRRASVLIENGPTRILVDTSPDLLNQCLDAGIDRLDAVLYTHAHADHAHGIDDLRFISYRMRRPIDVYANDETLKLLLGRFGYCFSNANPLYPAIAVPHRIEGSFAVGSIPVIPFRQGHGDMDTLGFRFGPIAYSTDVVELDDAAFAALHGVEVWVVDALRRTPHATHAHLDKTLDWIRRLQPKRAVLTHMNIELDYRKLCDELPAGVEPGYDGLVIETEG